MTNNFKMKRSGAGSNTGEVGAEVQAVADGTMLHGTAYALPDSTTKTFFYRGVC